MAQLALLSIAAIGILDFASPPSLTVNLQDSSVVSDVVTVTAQASSESGILKVEFSVDDQLRLTVTKPPYEYKWDTVDEDEGPHRMIVAAFDGDGKTVTKRIKVEVDNGLTAGVKPHAEKALALFRKGEFDPASLEGRKAYRINPADPDAIRAMSAAVGGKGDLNRAIDLLEKPVVINNQVIGDPRIFPLSDRVALELKGYFRVRRAGAQPNLAMGQDLGPAYAAARTLADPTLADARAAHPEPFKTPADRLAMGDALVNHGDYGAALAVYKGESAHGKDGLTARNREALAMLRLGRERDAELYLTEMIGADRGNDVTRALLAAVHLRQRKFKIARADVDGPVGRRSLTGLVMAAHADIYQRDFRRAFDELRQAAERADTVEIHYLASALITDGGDLKRATASCVEALLRDPTNLDVYALRGFQLAALVPNEGMAQAGSMFDMILGFDPKHETARIGKAIVLIHQKKFRAAEQILREIARTDPRAGDIWVSLAAAYNGLNERAKEVEGLEQAKRVEPERFPDPIVPKIPEFIQRVGRYRRPPLLTPALLALEETGGSSPAAPAERK